MPRQDVAVVRGPEVLRVLGDETRRQTLTLLRVRPMTVAELANALGKDQSTVYRHVGQLEAAGLVEVAAERKEHHIPEKVYGRTAGLFLLAPEPGMSREDRELSRIFSEEETRKLLRALASLGVPVGTDDLAVAELQELVLLLDETIRPRLAAVRFEGEVELHTLSRLEMLLLLLEIRRGGPLAERLDAFLRKAGPGGVP